MIGQETVVFEPVHHGNWTPFDGATHHGLRSLGDGDGGGALGDVQSRRGSWEGTGNGPQVIEGQKRERFSYMFFGVNVIIRILNIGGTAAITSHLKFLYSTFKI